MVSDKAEPNDVDVFMVMDDNFDRASLTGEARLLYAEHSAAQNHFGCSVFWLRYLAEIDRMQLEVREYLGLHPAELAAAT